MQIRQAAAAAKRALLKEAAAVLNAKPKDLKAANGVMSGPNRKTVSYAALAGGKAFSITLDPRKPVPTKAPEDFSLVGHPVPRIDIPDKMTGRYTYMQDFHLPGMLHGRVVRPPAIGAALESVDEASVEHVPGIVKIVRQGNFLGIVATNEWAAIRGAQALQAGWSKWEGLPDEAKLFDYVRASKIARDDVTSNVGSADATLSQLDIKRAEATYDFAIHTHGSIGPSCAIAAFDGDKLTSWSASQATHDLRKQFAQMFSLLSTMSAVSLSRAPAAMAVTAMRMRPPTPPCLPRRWASPCASNGRAPTNMAGTQGAADPDRPARRHRQLRPRRRVGWRVFHPGAEAGDVTHRPVARRVARRIARRQRRRRNRGYQRQFEHSVHIPEYQDHLPPASIDAAASILDQIAGPDAEHLRERMFHR
jgi:hypothetical protein